MDRIYWLMVRDVKGNIVEIREAEWGYFHNNNGDFRSKIKRFLNQIIKAGESYEFALKINFINRGIINAHPEED